MSAMLAREFAALRLDSPSLSLTRLLELDAAFRPYSFIAGQLRARQPPVLEEMRARAPAKPFFARLFRQRFAHWRGVGLGRPSRLLRGLDGAIARRDAPALRLMRGRLLQSMRYFVEAADELDRVLERAPGRADARRWLGECRLELGDARRALVELDRALRLRPDDAWALAWRAEARRQLGDEAGAGRDHHRALELQPACAELRVLAGRDGDAAQLQAASRLDPRCVWAFLIRAHHAHRAGHFRGAQRDLTAALGLDPLCVWAYTLRARARRAAGDAPGAERDFAAALRLDYEAPFAGLEDVRRHGYLPYRPIEAPCEWLAAQVRAIEDGAPDSAWKRAVLSDLVDFRNKEDALRRGVEAHPDSALLHAFWGRVLGVSGRLPQAARALDRAIALDPGIGWLYGWRSELWRRARRMSDAERDLRRAARLAPGYPRVPLWHGRLKQRLGRNDEAVALFDRAFDFLAQPHSNPDAYQLCVHRGRTLIDAGRGLEAVWDLYQGACYEVHPLQDPAETSRLLAQADLLLRRRPRDARLRSVRAHIALRLGRLEDSLLDCQRALRLDPRLCLPYALRGQVRYRQGRWRAALEDAERAIARNPFASPFYALRLCALERLGGCVARRRRDLENYAAFNAWAWDAPLFRARLLRRQGRLAEALAGLDALIVTRPYLSWTYYERALVRLRLGRWLGGLRDLRLAQRPRLPNEGALSLYLRGDELFEADLAELERRQGAGVALAWKAALLPNDGLKREALELWRGLGGRRVHPGLLAWRAAALMEQGELRSAQRDLSAALQALPGFEWARLLKAEANLLAGLDGAAAAQAERLRREAPALVEPRVLKAVLRWRAGDFAGAAEEARAAVDADSSNAQAYADRLSNLRRFPGLSAAYVVRGLVSRQTGYLDKSRGELFSALELGGARAPASARSR